MLTFADFKTYPINIIGIDTDFDSDLQSMEAVATDLLAYSGDVKDVAEVIKYIVYLLFWQSRRSAFDAQVGEQKTITEFTFESNAQKSVVLFLARKKIKSICELNGETYNKDVFKLFYDLL